MNTGTTTTNPAYQTLWHQLFVARQLGETSLCDALRLECKQSDSKATAADNVMAIFDNPELVYVVGIGYNSWLMLFGQRLDRERLRSLLGRSDRGIGECSNAHELSYLESLEHGASDELVRVTQEARRLRHLVNEPRWADLLECGVTAWARPKGVSQTAAEELTLKALVRLYDEDVEHDNQRRFDNFLESVRAQSPRIYPIALRKLEIA